MRGRIICVSFNRACDDSWNCRLVTNVANNYKDIFDVFKCLSTVKGIAEEEVGLNTFTQLPHNNILNNTLLKTHGLVEPTCFQLIFLS